MDEDKQNNTPTPPAGDSMPPASGGANPQPMMGGGSPNKSKKMWLWLLILLLVLALLFFGWWWMNKDKKDEDSKKSSNSNSSQQQQQTATCDENFTEYENAQLGIGFCYPTDWGEVTVADAKFDAADTGERWKVQFTDKEMVNLGLVTEDWSTDVPRDGVCVDPAVQTLPAFSPFSTTWTTEGTPVMSASRGVEVQADQYLINEDVDDVLTSGVCLHGYTIINGDVFTHTSASYYAEFGGGVTTPQQHVDNPNTLVSAADRAAFATFVKSVHKL